MFAFFSSGRVAEHGHILQAKNRLLVCAYQMVQLHNQARQIEIYFFGLSDKVNLERCNARFSFENSVAGLYDRAAGGFGAIRFHCETGGHFVPAPFSKQVLVGLEHLIEINTINTARRTLHHAFGGIELADENGSVIFLDQSRGNDTNHAVVAILCRR